MTWFIRFVLAHRALVGALALLFFGVAIYSSRTIESRFQFRDFYDYPANPHVNLFKKDNEEFGDPAGYVVAVIETQEVFQKDVLAYVQRLTRALEPNSVFVRVRSLTNVRVVRGKGDDIVSGPLVDEIPESSAALEEVKQFALNSALLRRRLISVDSKTTAVLAEMRTPASFSTIAEQREAIAAVDKALSANPPPAGVHVRVTGAPVVEVGGTDALDNDQGTLMPFVLVLLLALLFITFRSWHGVVLGLTSVVVATVWTFGVFSLFGRPLDIISSIIPTTLLVYGVVDPIFVLARVLTKTDAGRPKRDAIVEAFGELGLPCFLTSLTTALGFGGFAFARAPMIRYYGITVGIGVMLAWVTTITVLPVLISLFPLPKRKFSSIRSTHWVDSAIEKTWGAIRQRSALVATIAVALVLGGGLMARSLYIDNTYTGDLPRGPILSDVRALEDKLSGVLRLIVHLEGPADSMKRPEVLKAIESVDLTMERDPLVTASTSVADLIAEANQAFQGGDAKEHVIPNSRSLVAQYFSLIDPTDRADFVSADYSKTHIALLIKDPGSTITRDVENRLQRAVDAANFPALGVRASLTGNGVVAYREIDEICRELLVGFLTALGIIVGLQVVVFRSLRLALISVLPNVLPVAACFATLRLLNYPLRIDSALVLCIAVGGLFNTTIHISARVRQRVAAGEHDPETVIGHALRAVGPASLFTALTLSAGFSVLMASEFSGLQMLGLLTVLTLMIGFVADMIVTPALIRIGFDWKKALRDSARPASPVLELAGPGIPGE